MIWIYRPKDSRLENYGLPPGVPICQIAIWPADPTIAGLEHHWKVLMVIRIDGSFRSTAFFFNATFQGGVQIQRKIAMNLPGFLL